METLTAEPAAYEPGNRPVGCIEIVGRGGRVVQQVALRDAVVHIGRGYDNDVVLDDPYVEPHHLSLWWDGQSLRVESHTVDRNVLPETLVCGGQLHIGRSLLRFRSACFPLTPTRQESTGFDLLTLLGKPLWQAGFLLLCLTLLLGDDYLGSASKYLPIKGITGLISVLLVVCCWAALWAFASRILVHQWNFWRHTTIALLAVTLLTLLEAGGNYAAFALNLDSWAGTSGTIAEFLIAAVALFLHLCCASFAPVRRLLVVSCGLSTLLVGLPLLFSLADRDFSPYPQYEVTFKPPVFRLVGSSDSAEFFAKGEKLFVKIDEEVAEARKEKQH